MSEIAPIMLGGLRWDEAEGTFCGDVLWGRFVNRRSVYCQRWHAQMHSPLLVEPVFFVLRHAQVTASWIPFSSQLGGNISQNWDVASH